jgi:hypothetical protein
MMRSLASAAAVSILNAPAARLPTARPLKIALSSTMVSSLRSKSVIVSTLPRKPLVKEKLSAPSPPVSTSWPPFPSITLSPALPLICCAKALPVRSMSAVPVKEFAFRLSIETPAASL